MINFEHLEKYYNNYDEENRLLSKHGQVEYLTTMAYICKYLEKGTKILEIGAGTGRYSIELAKMGFEVDAVELVQHNLSILKSKITNEMDINAYQGNALDLRFLENEYDIVLLLGPMYHLYTKEEQLQALSEAIRLTKKGGILFSAYCLTDATIYSYGFQRGQLFDLFNKGLLETKEYKAISTEEEVFQLYRKSDIDELIDHYNVERLHYVATDLMTNFMRDTIDNMDEELFNAYIKYHLAMCERIDLVGISHHALDITRKV